MVWGRFLINSQYVCSRDCCRWQRPFALNLHTNHSKQPLAHWGRSMLTWHTPEIYLFDHLLTCYGWVPSGKDGKRKFFGIQEIQQRERKWKHKRKMTQCQESDIISIELTRPRNTSAFRIQFTYIEHKKPMKFTSSPMSLQIEW